MNSFYTAFADYFEGKINGLLRANEISLVIYDETEYFRDWYDDNFPYPFVGRKNILSNNRYSVDLQNTGDYGYKKTYVKFQQSSACLEGQYYD
jgi:hypothetical protein